MKNPWKDIPLADYEGHMAKVAQAQLLAEVFGEVLKEYSPQSIGVIGCAGGMDSKGSTLRLHPESSASPSVAGACERG